MALNRNLAILMLVLFSSVGVIGFLSPWQELFIRLTPLKLIVSAMLLLSQFTNYRKAMIPFLAVASLGYGVEVLGVATGWPFGHYTYGQTLGVKLMGVPLMIGVNWAMLVMAVSLSLRNRPLGIWAKAAVGATILLLMDILIEPVAIENDFWTWENGGVPLTNYIGWWVVSFALVRLQLQFLPQSERTIGTHLLIILGLFFLALNILQ
jgi:bisanhydrobacterioruberin hydratase